MVKGEIFFLIRRCTYLYAYGTANEGRKSDEVGEKRSNGWCNVLE